MNINLTLLGEMITFAVLVIVTMKYIWPPITKAMQEREEKIADGLAAAERGQRNLELAQERITRELRAAKVNANQIIDQANVKVAQLIEDARSKASEEGKKMLALAEGDIGREMEVAKQKLQEQMSGLVIATAEKIIQQNIDKDANKKLIDQCIQEL